MDANRYLKLHTVCLENKRIQSQEKVDVASIIASGRHTDSYVYMLETNQNQQGQTIIERAMRHLLGRDTYGRPCIDGALLELAPLLDRHYGGNLKYSAAAPRAITHALDIIMKAHSLAAYAYFLKYTATPDRQRGAADDAQHFPLPAALRADDATVDSLIYAADHANFAACMQFISPAVLLAGGAFRDLAEYLGLDVWSGIKRYAPLWFALEWANRQTFDTKFPAGWVLDMREYLTAQAVCLAPGCDQSPGQKEDKQWCRGTCAWDCKPWYCSDKCRRKDWENHLQYCTPPRVIAVEMPPPCVTVDQSTRDVLFRDKLYPEGVSEVTQVEIMPDDANELDARNGTIQEEWELPSPYVFGETVKVVLKNYGPRHPNYK